VWAAVSVALFAANALAQEDRYEAPPEAIELYRSGRAHYEAGRYREAIVDLKAALQLDPESPNLVYNVARVSELLGDLSEAITYYERYLKLLPISETEERERIKIALKRLEGARQEVISRAAEEKTGLKAPSFPPSAPTPAPGKADALFWIAAGTGVAALATGAVMGVLALNRESQVGDFVLGPDGNLDDRERLVSEGDSFAMAADITVAAGAGAMVAAVLLFFLRESEAEEEAGTARFRMAMEGGNVSLEWRGAF
jgi:tetratricopeptide (TPR) repeat protein